MSGYLRSLNPRLPREVTTLQVGGLFNAFGNGVVLPFTLIYLHNVRGFSLGVAGLVLGTNAVVSLVAGPISGGLVDRVGGKRMLAVALLFLFLGIGGYALVRDPWHAFAAATLTGIGNGGFWPAQSTLIAGLTPLDKRPVAFAMQRVVMNLGIGLGGLAGGLIATTDEPRSFELLFVLDAATFVVFAAILLLFVPEPALRRERPPGEERGSYRDVFRNRVFVGLMAANAVFIAFGFGGFELLPAYAKNVAGVDEHWIGPIFFVNTIVIVLLQLPIARAAEGRRRMPVLLAVGAVAAVAWLLVPIGGLWLDTGGAVILFMLAVSAFAIGECLHGAVQAPLVADLAEPRLLGRYMATSALSWQVGFALGPSIGGFLLDATPTGLWLAFAAGCLLAGVASFSFEPRLPEGVRRTPRQHREPLEQRAAA